MCITIFILFINLLNAPRVDALTLYEDCDTPSMIGAFVFMENLENEIWKDVVGYEGLYQASNFGRIKSVECHIPYTMKGTKTTRFKKGVILKQIKYPKTGYFYVNLYNNFHENKKVLVHRLVATSFLGDSVLMVDHISGIKSDNSISNLRYCTNRENGSFENVNRPNKSSRYIGVAFHKREQKWRSQIGLKGRTIHLGSFHTEEEASQAYQTKLKEILSNGEH